MQVKSEMLRLTSSQECGYSIYYTFITHLRAEDVSHSHNKQYKVVVSDCGSSNSRGTVILSIGAWSYRWKRLMKGHQVA